MHKLFLVLFIYMTSATADSQSLTYPQILDRPGRESVQPDHRIAYGKDAQQSAERMGELWLPRSTSNSRHPLVVLIHGGCWRADLPGAELVAFLADELRKQGVAVWSLTYRRIGHAGGGYPGTFHDIAEGVDFLHGIAEKYRLDLSRAVVTGHSAGGHLALWAAAQHRIPAGSPLAHASRVKFKAVIGIAAIPDLAHFARAGAHACGEKTVEQLVDGKTRAAASGPANAPFRDTSPAEMLPLGIKQILVHGVFDGIVPPSIGWRYQTRAKETGESIELITLEAAGHFELIAPWTPAGKVVVSKILEALK